MTRGEKLALILTSTFGVLFLTAGGYFFSTTQAFLEKAISVDGIVIDLRFKGDTSHPIVEFTDHTGAKRIHYSSIGTYPPKHFIGEEVTLLYDPSDPKYPVKARIESTLDIWGVTIFFLGMGAFFILVSSLAWYMLKYHNGIWFFRKEDRLEFERTGRIDL